jgi:hypothetical protein
VRGVPRVDVVAAHVKLVANRAEDIPTDENMHFTAGRRLEGKLALNRLGELVYSAYLDKKRAGAADHRFAVKWTSFRAPAVVEE